MTYTLGKDSILFGGTFYIERVTPHSIVTTNDKTKALQFDSKEAAESFAAENNIRLVNFDSDSPEEVTTNYFTTFC